MYFIPWSFVTQDRRERFWRRALGRRELGNWNLLWYRRFDQREVFVPRRNARLATPTRMRCGSWQREGGLISQAVATARDLVMQ